MKQSIVKQVLTGIVLGALVFFTGPLIPIVLLLRFIFMPFGKGRGGRMNRFGGPGFAFAGGAMQGGAGFADKIRSMSEEDYTAFKAKVAGRMQGGNNCKDGNTAAGKAAAKQ